MSLCFVSSRPSHAFSPLPFHKKTKKLQGNTPADIGSGNEYVHNTYLFDRVEKAVRR